MIFDNYQKRQYIAIDGYHTLVGSRDQKIRVRKESDTNFKHPYYTHPRFQQSGSATHLIINGVPNSTKRFGANILVSRHSSIRSLAQPSVGNETVLATASIGSKTATANAHVQYEIARNGAYNHDTNQITLNFAETGRQQTITEKSTFQRNWNGRIFVYDNDETRRLFVPRGANTDIYADEESGGGSGGLSITQYWS